MRPITSAAKETPILFGEPMVEAILAGRKSVTRRVMKPQPPADELIRNRTGSDFSIASSTWTGQPELFRICGPVGVVCEVGGLRNGHHWTSSYGNPGDHLRLLTTWAVHKDYDGLRPTQIPPVPPSRIWSYWSSTPKPEWAGKRRPGRFTPTWARRLFPRAEVAAVRAERLQTITDGEILAEGVTVLGAARRLGIPTTSIRDLRHAWELCWDSINAKRGFGWAANPYVWRIAFKYLGGFQG